MRNPEIADAFDELADRLALTDLKPYRYMAYRKASKIFRQLADSVALLSAEGRLLQIEGIGPAIDDKVRDLLATGTFPALEDARRAVPDTLLALTRLPGVGPATARAAFAELDGESFEGLLARAAAGQLEVGGAFPKKLVTGLVAEAERRAAGGGDEKPGAFSGIPLDATGRPLPGPWFRRDQAATLHQQAIELLATTLDAVRPSGDYVRGLELLGGITLLGEAAEPAAALAAAADTLGQRGWEVEPSDASHTPDELADIDPARAAWRQVVSPAGIPLMLCIAAPEHAPTIEHRIIGPAAWVQHEPEPQEHSVPWELRDAVLSGRIAATEVPADLVTAADLRGELHAHSNWSDGKATILAMARGARARGDDYFCVTDHSAPYAMVGGLTPERVAAQAEEVAAANEQLARDVHEHGDRPFRVLQGIELEILADGTLGLPDPVLAKLDWVIASIHVQQRQDAASILARMERVLDNPLVDAIGHPTSRRLLIRDRTALDVPTLIAMAAERDVVLEINANPDRLDLDSEQAALALAAGVRLTVNTDAHRVSTLSLRDHGVAVARRAGARRVDVVNCLDADTLLAGRRRHV